MGLPKNVLFQSNFEIFTNGLIQRLFETNTQIFLSWHPYGVFLKLHGPTILVSCSNFWVIMKYIWVGGSSKMSIQLFCKLWKAVKNEKKAVIFPEYWLKCVYYI